MERGRVLKRHGLFFYSPSQTGKASGLKYLGGADIFLDHSGSTYIIPKLSLYSTGLMPPKVILIRSSLYQ